MLVKKTVPKMTMVSKAKHGGTISTRTFIPHRCHASIGVLGAVSVATACLLPNTPAAELSDIPDGDNLQLPIEHPIGSTLIQASVESDGTVGTTAIFTLTPYSRWAPGMSAGGIQYFARFTKTDLK